MVDVGDDGDVAQVSFFTIRFIFSKTSFLEIPQPLPAKSLTAREGKKKSQNKDSG